MVQHDPDVVARSRAVTGGLVAAMAFFLAFSSGCSSDLTGDVPFMRTGRLWTGPKDGATNLDVSTLALFVNGSTQVVGDAEIADLVSHMVLKTWPEETVVPSTIEEDEQPLAWGLRVPGGPPADLTRSA